MVLVSGAVTGAGPVQGSHEYVNTRMEEHAWFVGDMDRDQANDSMQLYPLGTFLVRARLQAGERVGYALSLRTKEDTKHMKINSGEHPDWGTKFYLSESHAFRSMVELISYYTQNSLKESFAGREMHANKIFFLWI